MIIEQLYIEHWIKKLYWMYSLDWSAIAKYNCFVTATIISDINAILEISDQFWLYVCCENFCVIFHKNIGIIMAELVRLNLESVP